jgi:RecB family endonuclease NucS
VPEVDDQEGEASMTTMAKAIREYVESEGGKFTADDIKRHITSEYPDKWKATTLQAHLYACVINNPKAYIHHPSTSRFLYRNGDGTFEIYSETVHGPNEWAPTPGDDETTDVGELIETSVSLERDIEDHLVHQLDSLESGLTLVGRQVTIDVGRIDILAEDSQGTRVVIEVKVGEAKDSAIGQIARYLGWYTRTENEPPRGIIVAGEFSDAVRYAASAIANLKLVTYQVQFSFKEARI